MMFRALAFVDASVFTAMLLTKYREAYGLNTMRQSQPGSPHKHTKAILLRGPKDASPENWQEDVPQINYPIMTEWKTSKSLLTRVAAAAATFNKGETPDLGKAMIVKLEPGGVVDWHIDEGAYAEAHLRLHLCLVPSPGAYLYSGGEQCTPPVGQLTFVNNRVLHGAVNFGPVSRVHLIVDVRKPDA